MVSILLAAVFAATPFYKPPPPSVLPPSQAGNGVPHVMHDHRHANHHHRYYSAGYIDNYYEPDASMSDAADDDEQPIPSTVIYQPAPPVRAIEEKRTFPTFSTIVVKGAPPGNGCTYKAVMTDDEINTCKRVAREELHQAR
jgi:hypothetical protein